MRITTDIKDNLLTHNELIENIEVIYKKKKKYRVALSLVKHNPFAVRILDDQNKEENREHIIDFEIAQQITIKFFDGTVKTFQDEVA